MVEVGQYVAGDEGVLETKVDVEQEKEDEEGNFDEEAEFEEDSKFDEDPNNGVENVEDNKVVFMNSPFQQSQEDEPIDYGKIGRESDKGKRAINLSDEEAVTIKEESDYEAKDH